MLRRPDRRTRADRAHRRWPRMRIADDRLVGACTIALWYARMSPQDSRTAWVNRLGRTRTRMNTARHMCARSADKARSDGVEADEDTPRYDSGTSRRRRASGVSPYPVPVECQ